MPKPTTQNTEPIQVDAQRGGDRPVVLTPEDQDRFVKSCQWVVEASQLGISRDVWEGELQSLLSYVRCWATDHADRVKACLASQRDGQLAIFVVPHIKRYDFELSDLLTDLDLELSAKFRACRCDVLQMPDKPLDEELSILIYGETSTT